MSVKQNGPRIPLIILLFFKTISMDFKVIRKEFPLPINIHRSTDEGPSNNEEVDRTSRIFQNDGSPVLDSLHCESATSDSFSILETVIETPKSHVRKKSCLDKNRIFETAQHTSDAFENVCTKTFPRRSQRIKSLHNHCITFVSNHSKVRARKILENYYSDEGTPSCIRKQRFMLENCNSISDIAHKSRQDEETYIQSMKAELEYYRSINKFHVQSRCNNLDEMEIIKKECDALRLQLIQKNVDIQNLIKEKQQMQVLINDLHAKLMTADLDKHNLKQTMENKIIQTLQRYFTEGQIRCILENRKWVKWSIDDYASAISFRSVSPKAYRYFRLKLNFPLPSLSALRNWALMKFDVGEGFLSDVLVVMREKGKAFTSFQKITVLTFDEMALSPEIQFDSKLEKLVGPCGKVQVIMARGLFENWKQPIYYKFDQQMTKDILMEAVRCLYDAGYEVVATTCDMGNRGVWAQLQITPDNHFFKHPVLENGKIFIFADIPHLLKLMRNWYIDEGFLLEHGSKPFTAEVMQAIIDIGKSGDLRVAYRLTQRILDARHSLRQAVKPAAQIWSHTVSQAIKWAGDNGLINIPDYHKFSDFVSTVNKWFDVHNSHQKYGAHPRVNGYGVNLDNQEMVVILMNLYIEKLRVGSRKSLMPFQKGILISNASLRRLYDYLKKKFPDEFKYILTRRLQQDVLENFFAYIRAMGSCKDHPSGYEFRYRLRWYPVKDRYSWNIENMFLKSKINIPIIFQNIPEY